MAETSTISSVPRGGRRRYTSGWLPHASFGWSEESIKDPLASMFQTQQHGVGSEHTRLDLIIRSDTRACGSLDREVPPDLKPYRQAHLREVKWGQREVAGLPHREEQAHGMSVRRSCCVGTAGDGRFAAPAALMSVERERRRRSVS